MKKVTNGHSAHYEAILAAFGGQTNHSDADLILLADKISTAVESFLVANNLAVRDDSVQIPGKMRPVEISLESIGAFGADAQVEGAFSDLLTGCGITSDSLKNDARAHLALLTAKYCSGNVMAYHLRASTESIAPNHIPADVYSPAIVSALANPGLSMATESFGANINNAIPDIKLAYTVALMRYHLGLTPRMVPTRNITSPTVMFIVPEVSVFDVGTTGQAMTPLVELFPNPSIVSNTLPDLHVLTANDTNSRYLVADDVMKFGVSVPMLELSIDATKPGYDRINYTDTVADGVELKSIRVGISITGIAGGAVKTFVIPVRKDVARLYRMTQGEASMRGATIVFDAFLHHNTTEIGGDVSALFDAADVDTETNLPTEGLKLSFNLQTNINLKTGVCFGLGAVSAATHVVDGGAATAEWTAATTTVTDCDKVTVSLLGFSMNAKHSEENLRRSSIAVRVDSRQHTWEVPIGRHYFADTALTQEVPDAVSAALSRTTTLGEDDLNINTVIDALDSLATAVRSVTTEGLSSYLAIGRAYAAGAMVRPYVISTTFTVSDLHSVRDADRSGDVKQRFLSFMTALSTEILENSFYQTQLANGAKVVLRIATSVGVLGNIIGQPHIHTALDNGKPGADASGVQYRTELPNGVILEVAVSTFDVVKNRMIILPYVADAESVLSFGVNCDMGTVVGKINPWTSRDGGMNRMYANARQMIVPTCPVGAVVDVAGTYLVNTQPYNA